MSTFSWDLADVNALKEFFKRVPAEKIRSLIIEACPAKVDVRDILTQPAEGVSRIAAMRAGWEGAIDRFIALVDEKQAPQVDPGYKDMT